MDIKTLLASESKLLPNVLAGFDPSYSPDHELLSEVTRLSSLGASFFVDPYHLETNVADVARLLDRLLVTRRELWELDAARQRMALSYISTMELVEADAKLSVAEADKDKKNDVGAASSAKVEAARRNIEALETRHGQVGGSLNFQERIAKLRNSFRDDIESCHVRSEAIVKGLAKRSYFLELPRPRPGALSYVKFDGAAHLDDWASWHRKLTRQIEARQASLSEFEISIPLTTSRLVEFVADDREAEVTSVVAEKLVDDIRAGREVSCDLSDRVETEFFGPHEEPGSYQITKILYRIPRHCGHATIQEVSLQVDVDSASRNEGWRFVVEIKPPDTLAGVTLTVDTSALEPVWIGSPAITHRSARGQWLLRFHSAIAADAAAKQVARTSWPIEGIRLLMRVQGVA